MILPPWLRAADNLLVRHVLSPRIMIRPSRPIVTFTFDDIPASAATLGADILERHGVGGTFYIAGRLITGGAREGFADVDACRKLALAGHELGCHTFSHTGLRNMDGAQAAADLAQNEEFFSSIASTMKPSNFAYPFNKSTVAALPALRSRLRTARGGHAGINRGSVAAYQLSAVEIAQPEDPNLDDWLDDLAREPGWLIYFTHDVSDSASRYGSRPATLDRLVHRASTLGHEVLTVDAALDRMGLLPRRNQ
jgi:peptidoglycan/xylan/chitin deacetylase (PgdA/CDA1 family)